jgi:hypothetical protein
MGKEPTDPDQAIQKATLLLDLKSDADGAEAVLREALAQHSALTPGRVRAQIFLGELLLERGNAEGAAELHEALSAELSPEWSDILAADLARARRALERVDA